MRNKLLRSWLAGWLNLQALGQSYYYRREFPPSNKAVSRPT
ncbi:hypothetical protein D554_2710 [Bordetella holmesii 30539]|nr:hypothetical protein D554_2710 [Bordetella holmesii 30539]